MRLWLFFNVKLRCYTTCESCENAHSISNSLDGSNVGILKYLNLDEYANTNAIHENNFNSLIEA